MLETSGVSEQLVAFEGGLNCMKFELQHVPSTNGNYEWLWSSRRGSFPRGTKLATHSQIAPRLRIRGTITPPLLGIR
jgi:hypothetical protein